MGYLLSLHGHSTYRFLRFGEMQKILVPILVGRDEDFCIDAFLLELGCDTLHRLLSTIIIVHAQNDSIDLRLVGQELPQHLI